MVPQSDGTRRRCLGGCLPPSGDAGGGAMQHQETTVELMRAPACPPCMLIHTIALLRLQLPWLKAGRCDRRATCYYNPVTKNRATIPPNPEGNAPRNSEVRYTGYTCTAG